VFDPTLGQLQGLEPTTRDVAQVLIDYLRNNGIPAIITAQGGRRNEAEQAKLVQMGLSRTSNSAHLAGRAFDLDVLGYSRDEVPKWLWQHLGQIAESAGLIWGGRWGWDWGHFEVPVGWPNAPTDLGF